MATQVPTITISWSRKVVVCHRLLSMQRSSVIHSSGLKCASSDFSLLWYTSDMWSEIYFQGWKKFPKFSPWKSSLREVQIRSIRLVQTLKNCWKHSVLTSEVWETWPNQSLSSSFSFDFINAVFISHSILRVCTMTGIIAMIMPWKGKQQQKQSLGEGWIWVLLTSPLFLWSLVSPTKKAFTS